MSNETGKNRLRALIVEDSPDDVELILLELEAAGYAVESKIVETEAAMEAVLPEGWDIILSDYLLPRFDGLQALQVIHRSGLQIPLILVSSAIGEEVAATAMRTGARDFIRKDHLARLAPAVERELREAAERRARRQAEKAYRDLIEQSLLGILVLQENRVAFANQAMADMLGYSIDEMTGAEPGTIMNAIHPEDRQAMWSRFSDHIAAATPPISNEFCLQRRDGKRLWVVASESTVQLGGRPAVQLAFVDITLRRQLEEALARGKEEWERTFDTVSELILLTDDSLQVVRLNQAPCARLSVHPRTLIGRPAAEVIGCPPEAIPIDSLAAGTSVEINIDSETLGGLFRFSITPLQSQSGKLEGAVLVGHDITAQSRLEELERRQITVDQAEHIFRTFRHETGNALNTLKTTLSVFRSGFEEFSEDKKKQYFARCFEALRIAEQILFAVRRYQTLDEVRLQPVELGSFIRQKADLLFESARGRGVSCSLDICPQPLPVECDPDALVRVLLNLVENGAAAVMASESPQVELKVCERKGQAVLEVTDNGCGIKSELLHRVFSPLFSTKTEGTGMGLAIVQKLMVRMNGLATLSSEEGLGTTVTLHLPVVVDQ
jgi:PAS domain S-box-containing protein